MNRATTNLIVNFDEIHVIAREIIVLRHVVELEPHPEVQQKVARLQALAATAQSAALSIQRNCDALNKRVTELENELDRMSDKNGLSQHYSTPFEELEMCNAFSEEDYLLVFRDTAGSRLTLQLRSEAIPRLVEKLKACQ